MSNSAYADQRVYGGDISDISNSPFTDERRQGGGGGSPSDGTGNVQYDITNKTLNTRLAEINTIIPDINQGASGFVIGNDVGSLNFDATDGNIKITHGSNETGNILLECETTTGGNGNIILLTDTVGTTGAGNLNANISGNILLNSQQAVSITSALADATLQAGEIVRTTGLKGAVMQAGLDNNGDFENQINMTLDTNIAILEIKSEGETQTNGINIITRTNANQGCIIALNSTETPTVPDRIVNTVVGIPPFQAGLNNQAWFTVQGTSATDSIARRMLFFEKKAEFLNFTTIAFSGGTVDPVFEFKANQYYQFINDPTGTGDVLTVTAGSGTETDPWGMEWLPSSGGGGGNVTSNLLTNGLTRDNGTGTQDIITTIDQGDNNFTIKNYNENEIIMSRGFFGTPTEKATIELKSFGDAFENRILLNTFRTASTGTSLLMTSSDDVSQPNFIRFTTSNIILDSTVPYFQVDGSPNGTAARRRFRLSDKEAYFGSFRTLNFSATNTGQTQFNPSYKWNGANYYRWDNTPVPSQGILNSVLTVTSGNGLEATPFSMNWVNAPTNGGLNTLDINFNQETSVLVLSDPVDGVISTTTIVGGRTVLVEDVTVNGSTEVSALGLSNSIFPPPLEGQAGYFGGLIGNSPPRVSLNPVTGLTNWFKGASFRATLSGEIVNIVGGFNIVLSVYSNRGQGSQNILNTFNLVTRPVSPPPQLGWKWVVDFTCRSVNDGGILGVLATSSSFEYSDDKAVIDVLGAIVSNTNSSFDTSVEQFLDFTIKFDVVLNSNIKTTLATIERIY